LIHHEYKFINLFNANAPPCGKKINDDTWNTPGEMLQW
jgi:hypothetical protein